MAFQIRVILATLIVASVNLVYGQVSTSCTTSMMSSFTPCANIITGSTNNGLVPPSTCCDLLRSLMSTNMDCACLVISANAPFFQQPISQALALSLSQACSINGVPLQCKGANSIHAPLHINIYTSWQTSIFPFSFPDKPIRFLIVFFYLLGGYIAASGSPLPVPGID